MLDVRDEGLMEAQTASPRRNGRRRATATARKDRSTSGLGVERRLTTEGQSPFDVLEWEQRLAQIKDDKGNIIFKQDGVEAPRDWSMRATRVVASKYFYGPMGSSEREHSVRQLVHRVARTIADWGLEDGYFASRSDAEVYYDELSHVCVNQMGSFNSPVWFNVGLHQVYGYTSANKHCRTWDPEKKAIVKALDSYRSPQASACFIQAVDDTMEDIMRLASAEALLFKYGSGTGTDLSTLRSSREKLSGGGTPSGPLSFMRVYDQVAAVIKSGGKTRRAAKMQSLKVRHPDIREFIRAKLTEEKKAWSLIDAGYDGSFGGEAYESVMFQNANLSVRVTDEFMKAVEADGEWTTRAVLNGEPVETFKARELMREIAEGTHVCGDPGLQYDTTINRWHTCKQSGRINASNPCSEYMFLDDSACNLASINLMKFVDANGCFDVPMFRHVVRLFIIAQDILVDRASYPTHDIAANSHRYRPLGLGYANLGAVIMRLGMPYDSDAGRAYAAGVTALMTGTAYACSQDIAETLGVFDGYAENSEDMIDVMKMHQAALASIDEALCPSNLLESARAAWGQVVQRAPQAGFRNAQMTVLAPTGTIGFMMDCDTTGVEPDVALVKYKQLAGGGQMKLINRTVPPALRCLGYSEPQIEAILKYIEERETIEGAPELRSTDLPVFDCAFRPVNGMRFISYKAHLRMMGAVQPFLSGAISKTVNVPAETSVDEIMKTYVEGWGMGLKAVAIYRDGSKRTQPLSTGRVENSSEAQLKAAIRKPFRRRMPATRMSITHKFEVAGHEGYLTVGMYEDGSPGELFITMAKEGSTVGGTMDAFGTAISLCLQYGVPVPELCQKFAHSRFEPSGFTKNPDIPIAKSIVDYIFRWLSVTFPNGRHGTTVVESGAETGAEELVARAQGAGGEAPSAEGPAGDDRQIYENSKDAPACDNCGAITVRNGACYRCYNCGNSMGCS